MWASFAHIFSLRLIMEQHDHHKAMLINCSMIMEWLINTAPWWSWSDVDQSLWKNMSNTCSHFDQHRSMIIMEWLINIPPWWSWSVVHHNHGATSLHDYTMERWSLNIAPWYNHGAMIFEHRSMIIPWSNVSSSSLQDYILEQCSMIIAPWYKIMERCSMIIAPWYNHGATSLHDYIMERWS